MKIRIEIQNDLEENEVLIRCARMDAAVERIHKFIMDQAAGAPGIVFYKENREFYFPLERVLFFETEDDLVYAHTRQDSYKIKHRLYELEEMLPRQFVRASKSTILNADGVLAITRNLAAASLVEFAGTHKHVYVSRRYFPELRKRLEERRNET